MLIKLTIFVFLGLTFAVINIPARVIDQLIIDQTNNGLRLHSPTGTIWNGSGELAYRSNNELSETPFLPVRWSFDFSAIMQLKLEWRLDSYGKKIGTAAIDMRGIEIKHLDVQLPVNALLFPTDQPLSSLGLNGDLNIEATSWRCNLNNVCLGSANIKWESASSSLFPGRKFGNYNLTASANDDGININIKTSKGEVNAQGIGKINYTGATTFNGTVRGDEDFLKRLPAVAKDHAQPSATPGEYLINYTSS